MAASENSRRWEKTYREHSDATDELKDKYLRALDIDQVLTYEEIDEQDIDRAITDNFDWLAKQYVSEYGVEEEEVDCGKLKRDIKKQEKGVALGPLSRVNTSIPIMGSIQETYEEAVGEDKVIDAAELVNEFYSEVSGKYNPEHNKSYNQETPLDLFRLQHDIAEGGRAFAYAIRDTSTVFDEFTREEVIPEMIQGIARTDDEGEYIDEIIGNLEVFVENYFENNFENRIVGIENTVEVNEENIEELIGRVSLMEGSISLVDEITEDIDEIYSILEDHSDDIESVTDRVDDLEGRIDEYNQELEELEAEIHEYVDEQISELEDRVSDNEAKIGENKGQIDSLRTDLNDLESTVSALSGLDDDISSLHQSVEAVEDRVDEYGNRLNDIEDELDAMSDQVEQNTGRLDEIDEHHRRMGETDREVAERIEEEMSKGLFQKIRESF